MTSYLSGLSWSEFTASDKPGVQNILLRVLACAEMQSYRVLFGEI